MDGKTKVFPIGKHIKDELLTRDWTQSDLAFVMGRKPTEISSFDGWKTAGWSPELAQELGIVLGKGAEYWLSIDNAYPPLPDRLRGSGGASCGRNYLVSRSRKCRSAAGIAETSGRNRIAARISPIFQRRWTWEPVFRFL